MHQLKFRIWDKSINGWLHDTRHAISLLGEYIIMGEILRRPDDTLVPLSALNDLVVMQLTGAKTPGGSDIFESDILAGHPLGYGTVTWLGDGWHCLFAGRSQQLRLGEFCNQAASGLQIVGNSFDGLTVNLKPPTGATDHAGCWCHKCVDGLRDPSGLPLSMTRFIVCPLCGNKRCPKATDHTLHCTGSNDPGQPGSIY